jgi:hypothetical protein
MNKANYNENLKGPDTIKRIKEDSFKNGIKIATYGKRDLWMPVMPNFKRPTIALKSPLIHFDKDGKEIPN